jgi:hypothetical protein
MTPDSKLRELVEHYDTTDLAEHIDQASWEEPEAIREPMVTYALRLPKQVIDRLRAAAEHRDIKVSTLMREWLEERLTLEATETNATVPVSALLALVAERGSSPASS